MRVFEVHSLYLLLKSEKISKFISDF